MTTPAESKNARDLSLAQTTVALARHYLGGRRALIVLTVLALGASLYFNWGWLAAAGIAPLLLALAPCAAMCALGICMNKMGGKSCSSAASPVQSNGTDTPSQANVAKTADEAAAQQVESPGNRTGCQ